MPPEKRPSSDQLRDGEKSSGASVIFLSAVIGALAPVLLGIGYGLLFLESWNIWPAFLIAMPLVGGPIGLAIGALIVYFRR